MTVPVKVLFVNEGALGSGVLGHARVGSSLRAVLGTSGAVGAEVVTVPPMGRAARLASRSIPGLSAFDLDLMTERWLSVQRRRGRIAVERALASDSADAIHVGPHTLALDMRSVMRTVPTFVSVDATVWAWRAQARWRPIRRHSRAVLRRALARERDVLAAAEAVIAWTAWARDGILDANPYADVVVAHPGIDLCTFRPGPAPDGPPRVLFVGGAFVPKGGDELLEAMGPLLDQGVELDIVTGDSVAPRRGVRVHRLGPDDPALVTLYQRATVFCLPTRSDASPLSVVEAMATGTAVIVSDVAANRELVDDGGAGVVVPAQDPSALRDALTGLIADTERRVRLGKAGRARCEAHYDARKQVAALLALVVDRL